MITAISPESHQGRFKNFKNNFYFNGKNFRLKLNSGKENILYFKDLPYDLTLSDYSHCHIDIDKLKISYFHFIDFLGKTLSLLSSKRNELEQIKTKKFTFDSTFKISFTSKEDLEQILNKKIFLLKDKIKNLENNLYYSLNYFDIFNSSKKFTYLDKSISLLKTSLNYKCSLKSEVSNFQKGFSYFSNNKFCSYSNKVKIKEHSVKVKEILELAQKLDLKFNLLTLTAKNFKPKDETELNSFVKNLNYVQNRFFNTLLSKENLFKFENFMKIEKQIILRKYQAGKISKTAYALILDDINFKFPKFINNYLKLISLKNKVKNNKSLKEDLFLDIEKLEKTCLISRIIKGYIGTLETTISKKGEFNIHKHLLILQKDFISQYFCKFLFTQCCKRYGKFKEIQNSFILQFSKTPIYFKVRHKHNKKRLLKISNYIFKYISKGNYFKNKQHCQLWIKATVGIRLISSGGLLSQRNLKNYISLKYVEDMVSQHIFFGKENIFFTKENSFFEKDFFLSEKLKEDINFLENKKLKLVQIRNALCFGKFNLDLNHYGIEKIPQYQTYFFKYFKQQIFSKKEKICSLTRSKLKFQNVEKKSKNTSLINFFDLSDCLYSCSEFYKIQFLNLENLYLIQSQKISKVFLDNSNKIFENNLGVSYLDFLTHENLDDNKIQIFLNCYEDSSIHNLIFNQVKLEI